MEGRGDKFFSQHGNFLIFAFGLYCVKPLSAFEYKRANSKHYWILIKSNLPLTFTAIVKSLSSMAALTLFV